MSKSKQKTGEFRIEKKEFEYPPKVTLTEHSYQRYQAGDLPGGRRATLPELNTIQKGLRHLGDLSASTLVVRLRQAGKHASHFPPPAA